VNAEIFYSTGDFIKSVCDGAASLLFPYRCAGCDRLDVKGFCRNCFDRIDWIDPELCCVKCCEPVPPDGTSAAGVCSRCRSSRPSYTSAVSAVRYVGPVPRAVVLWKYEGNRYLSGYFADILKEWIALRAPKWFEEVEIIVPAPLHPRTLKKRGFSPPEELASRVAAGFGKSYAPRLLFKVRQTQPQARLSMEERVCNVQASMMAFDRSLIEGKIVLVIDDVMTTGATMSECARSLKVAGAKCVYGMTFARQAGFLNK